MLDARILRPGRYWASPCSPADPNSPSASLSRNSSHFLLSYFLPTDGPQMIDFRISGVEFAFLPSGLGFFISSTLISFFLTLRVEFTSLCNLLNFTDSSVSSSDCSLDCQRNKGKVNQIIARCSSASLPVWTLGSSAAELGAPTKLPNRFLEQHVSSS